MRPIDGDALLKRVQDEEIQAQAHGREFSTCFMSPGGTPSTEWWYVEDLIENAPTIEPERKKGKWISKGCGEYRCSLCRNIVDLDEEILMSIKMFNYCPVCGEEMK